MEIKLLNTYSRKYSITDAQLVKYASSIVKNLPFDIKSFKDFDHLLSDTLTKDIQQSLAKLKLTKLDTIIFEDIVKTTKLIHNCMSDCYDTCKTIIYFFQKAFKDQPNVIAQFEFETIESASKSTNEMLTFVQSLVTVTAQNKTYLEISGMHGAAIDSLINQKKQLIDLNNHLNEIKRQRLTEINKRIGKLNELYDLVHPVHEISKIIFAHNADKLKKYQLPG
ncbi:MAG: hypothetical protein MI922_14140 [Bacteroidales bacterium]|nr:hypothetical protein [Bacteroidales bacterium]